MFKLFKQQPLLFIVLGSSLLFALLLPFIHGKEVSIPVTLHPTVTVAPRVSEFSYKGEAGKDALTILKAKTKVEQAASGLVIAINGRKADDKEHEYWAFYVNGKMASVGPADYQTKNTDMILWKIEKY